VKKIPIRTFSLQRELDILYTGSVLFLQRAGGFTIKLCNWKAA